MSGDERRQQILETAVDLFSRHGFSGTTTKMIAEAAGVSEAMVFRHFSTKDELYGAILHEKGCDGGEHRFPWEGNEQIGKAIEERDDLGFFYSIALMAMAKHKRDVGFLRLLFYSALEEHELAERFFREFVSPAYEFIGGYIEKRQKEGAMRKVNPRVVVRAFMGMLIHHSLNNILWDRNRSILDISDEDAAKHFAELILNGVSTLENRAATKIELSPQGI